MMATAPRINLKIRFEYLNEIDDLLVCYIDAGKLKFEMIMTYEIAIDYIINLRVASTEPRERVIYN